MTLFGKIITILGIFTCSSVFAITNRLDILAFGGYSQASQFSDASLNNQLGTMTGFNGGGSAIITLANSIISPAIGIGGDFMQLKGKSQVSSTTSAGTITYNSTLNSQAGVGQLGARLTAPMLRVFLLGNAGYGFSDKLSTEVSQGSSLISTVNYNLKNHVFYGGTAILLVSMAPFIKMGLSGIYNSHSADFVHTISNVSINSTYQEITGNLVIDISL